MRVLALVLGVAAVIASWYFAEEFALELLIFSAYLFSPYKVSGPLLEGSRYSSSPQ